jgi:iron complex outermembrane recepter protein
MRLHNSFRKAGLSLAISCAAITAYAAEDTARIEEITVTAQKRSQSVQEVPATITAISGETLDNSWVKEITDLQYLVPSMMVGQLYGSNQITLRGVSTGLTSGMEDPSVAVHIDGVYQARSRTLDIAMIDLDRIEVLSGPQGTLYGRNATGGVVNYISKAPSSEFEGDISVAVGNYKTTTVKGTVSGPLAEGLSFRLSGVYDNRDDGFTKNLLAGAPKKRFEENEVRGGRATLVFDPSDNVKLSLDGFYVETNTSPVFAALQPAVDAGNAAWLQPQTLTPHKIYSEVDQKLDNKVKQVAFTATWDATEDVTLKSITGYQKFDDKMAVDNDGTPVQAVVVFQDDHAKTITQEFNLTANLFDDRLTSTFGLYYFDDKFKNDAIVYFFTDPVVFPPAFHTFLLLPNEQDSKSYSAYTDQTFALTDRLRLIAGIRYNKDKKTGRLCFGFLGNRCTATPNELKWNAWTPKFGVQYDVSDDVMVYAQYQEGFKSGGFVSNSGGDTYAPEHIRGPEVGIKSELWDHRVRLNAAAWYYKYEDLQVQQNIGVGVFTVNNAAKAKLSGAEISLEVRPTPQFTINLAAMAQSAKYDEFLNCNQTRAAFACSSPASSVAENLKDNYLNRAPKYTANLGLQYAFNMPGGGELLLRGESYWSAAVFYDEFNSEGIRQKPYSTQNAFVTYTPASEKYAIRAFAKNIGDEEYIISGFYASAETQFVGSWAPPRTYGAEVMFKF